MTDPRPSPSGTGERTTRSGPLLAALAAALAVALVALTAFVLLRDEPGHDLEEGLAGVAIGAEVEGDDLLVVDTVQGTGVFVETQAGPVYVRYGDDIADRFGIGTVVDVEGEVALVAQLDETERQQVYGGLYVVAEELQVDEG